MNRRAPWRTRERGRSLGIALGVVIVGLALSTFVTRTSVPARRRRGCASGHRVEVALRYAPVCTLAAIIVPDILMHPPAATLDLSLLNPRLIGALAAGSVVVLVAQPHRMPGVRHGGVHAGETLSMSGGLP
mgnify:CR=1 FL=1